MKIYLLITIFLNFLGGFINASEEFEEKPYERFVSLGDRCHVTFNINYYLGVRTDNPSLSKGPVPLNDDLAKRKPYFWGAFPFDWVRIESYPALIRFIDRNFSHFFEKEELTGFWEGNNQVLHDKLNLITRRHFLSKIVLKEKTQEFIKPVWDEDYVKSRERVGYLIDKFRDLKKYKTLYIINALLPDNQLIALQEALEKNRGNRNFTILLCNHQIQDGKIGDHIILRKTPCLNWETRWYWDLSVLDEFKLDPQILAGLRESYNLKEKEG